MIVERYGPGASMPVHRHQGAYAALILEGGYQEFGMHGRCLCEAGDLVLHPEFDIHGDEFMGAGCRLIDISLPHALVPAFAVFRLHDPDQAVVAARSGNLPRVLPQLLERSAVVPAMRPPPVAAGMRDALSGSGGSIAIIAAKIGVSREHATRTFTRWHGMTPGAFRRERRLRQALRGIGDGIRLAGVAADAGYADQSHMTRSMGAQLGFTPGHRRSAAGHNRSRG